MKLSFSWLGNAGFEFRLGNSILLVDPFLTRPRQTQVYFGRVAVDTLAINEHVKTCSHILVSHTHFDHFMDVPEIAVRTGAVIHGSVNTCKLALSLGIPENQLHQINENDEFEIEDIEVKVIPAVHPWIPGYASGRIKTTLKQPLRLRDYRMDSCLSFLITYKRRSILVWSSIAIENSELANILICRAVSDETWYTRLLAGVQPHLVIPGHWDDMFGPLSVPPRPYFSPPRLALPPLKRIDLGEFERKIKKAKPDCEVLLPERFKEYVIFRQEE